MKNYRVYVVKTTIVEMCLDAKDKYDAKERWKDGVELMETDIACEAISAERREDGDRLHDWKNIWRNVRWYKSRQSRG